MRDLARSVRDRRYLYIRNYMPHLGYNQPTAWPDNGEIRHEFYRLAKREKMTDAQWHYAGPTRPIEELYDCQTDPQNLKNSPAPRRIKKSSNASATHTVNTSATLSIWASFPRARRGRCLTKNRLGTRPKWPSENGCHPTRRRSSWHRR